MRLLSDRVLVRLVENKSGNGLYLGSMEEKRYEVVLVGDDVKHVSVGDIIRSYKFSSGVEIEYNGSVCTIFRESCDIDIII